MAVAMARQLICPIACRPDSKTIRDGEQHHLQAKNEDYGLGFSGVLEEAGDRQHEYQHTRAHNYAQAEGVAYIAVEEVRSRATARTM